MGAHREFAIITAGKNYERLCAWIYLIRSIGLSSSAPAPSYCELAIFLRPLLPSLGSWYRFKKLILIDKLEFSVIYKFLFKRRFFFFQIS